MMPPPLPAPFSPLVAGGEGLERYPSEPTSLGRRMAGVYGVPADHVLPVRGVAHGLELVFRLAARERAVVEAPAAQPCRRLSELYPSPPCNARLCAVILEGSLVLEAVVEAARRSPDALIVVNEGLAEFADTPSASALIDRAPNMIVLRSLSLAYGLAGARVGAALGRPPALARLASVLEPHAIPEVSARLALQALHPSRMIETAERIRRVVRERARVATALAREAGIEVEPGTGPVLAIRLADPVSALAACARLGVEARREENRLLLPIALDPAANDRLLATFDVPVANRQTHRTGEAIRDTRETRIVCAVDLDATGPVMIRTGIGFFDHMLEQVAAHGGFSLRLSCEGDLHIDPHHTVEDSAIALGQALKQALGDRIGVTRYGFVLPMDDAEAKVSLDLSGRPYAVFEGAFNTARLGDYPTDLTAHVLRSLAEHVGAAIHVAVTGVDDHHKTEACYKALGRALRQAIKVEGRAVPSTKGVL